MRRHLPFLLRILGMVLCTVPTVLAVLEHFPLWMGEGVMVPGLSAVLLCLAAIPLLNVARKRLKSPSVWMFWLFLWVILSSVRRVIDGLCAVAMVSFLGGVLGALCFRLGKGMHEGSMKQDEG